jgi:simple sugar transport system permease protein
MVILAGWRPGIAALACVGMAIAATVSIQLQIVGVGIPRDLTQLLPYVLTLVVLVFAGSRPPPAALGHS